MPRKTRVTDELLKLHRTNQDETRKASFTQLHVDKEPSSGEELTENCNEPNEGPNKSTSHPRTKPSESKPKNDELTQMNTQLNSNNDGTQKETVPYINHSLTECNVTDEPKEHYSPINSLKNDTRKPRVQLGGTANKSLHMYVAKLWDKQFTQNDIKTKIPKPFENTIHVGLKLSESTSKNDRMRKSISKMDSNADHTHEPLTGRKITSKGTGNCKNDLEISPPSTCKKLTRNNARAPKKRSTSVCERKHAENNRLRMYQDKTTPLFKVKSTRVPTKRSVGGEGNGNLTKQTQQDVTNSRGKEKLTTEVPAYGGEVTISEEKVITKNETILKTKTLTKYRNDKISLVPESMQCGTMNNKETAQRKPHCRKAANQNASINLMNRRSRTMSTNSQNVATRKQLKRKSIKSRKSMPLTEQPQEFGTNIPRRILIRVAHENETTGSKNVS